MREFKVGDKVRVLGKTQCGDSWRPLGAFSFKGGDKAEIKTVYDNPKNALESPCGGCKGKLYGFNNGGLYHEQDLEHIQGDDIMPKWKTLGNLCANNFYKDGDITCQEFSEQFFNLLKVLQPPTLHAVIHTTDLMIWANLDSKRTKWLLEKGYIEEVQSDPWDYKTGTWVEISWEDVDKLQDGVFVDRFFNGSHSVKKLVGDVFWRDFGSHSKLLAIKYNWKGGDKIVHETYLSDLFGGDKVLMRE